MCKSNHSTIIVYKLYIVCQWMDSKYGKATKLLTVIYSNFVVLIDHNFNKFGRFFHSIVKYNLSVIKLN